jgi:hypothetical protein
MKTHLALPAAFPCIIAYEAVEPTITLNVVKDGMADIPQSLYEAMKN